MGSGYGWLTWRAPVDAELVRKGGATLNLSAYFEFLDFVSIAGSAGTRLLVGDKRAGVIDEQATLSRNPNLV